jgi:hypothetical protein
MLANYFLKDLDSLLIIFAILEIFNVLEIFHKHKIIKKFSKIF